MAARTKILRETAKSMNLSKLEKELLKKLADAHDPQSAFDLAGDSGDAFFITTVFTRLVFLREHFKYVASTKVEGSEYDPAREGSERQVWHLTEKGRERLKTIDQESDRTFLDECGYLAKGIWVRIRRR